MRRQLHFSPVSLRRCRAALGPIGLVLAGLLLAGCRGRPAEAPTTEENRERAPRTEGGREVGPIAFTGVHLLPMDRDTVLRNGVLLVEAGEILGLGATGSVEVPDGARRIDAEGAYLLPGLVDAHAHAGEEALPLYSAAGVTTVRLMHGFPERLARRRRVPEESDLPWPTLLTAGPLIAGEEVPWEHVLVESPERARDVAEEQAGAGYDFLKVYDGLSRASYDALVDRARELGMPFAGHVPADVGVERTLEAGQSTIEHAEQLLYATFGRSGVMELPTARTDTIVHLFQRAPEPAAEGADRAAEGTAEPAAEGTGEGVAEGAERAAEDRADRRTCVTPTLRGMTLIMRRGTPFTDSVYERLDWDLVDPDLREWWESYRPSAPADARPRRAHFLEIQRDLTRKLHEAGVPILAGTDTPYPLLLPGASLVEEVQALADAGLSRFEALAAATRNPGRCLGDGEAFGVLRPGARADLLLLSSDPRADLSALERPLGVMVRGEWYDAGALDDLREGVKSAYAP